MNYNLITILGPTAVGKTRLAALLANKFYGEIISADSRQVYRGMNIGTGKDLEDYLVEGKRLGVHLVDIIDPSEEYNLFDFTVDFKNAYGKITLDNKIPFLVGGTGLYLHSILKGYNLTEVNFNSEEYQRLEQFSIEELKDKLYALSPTLHNTTDLLIKERIIRAIIVAEKQSLSTNDEKELKINSLNIGVHAERDVVKKRITERLKKRLEEGMIEEVENLLGIGVTHEKLEFFGLEYKFIAKYLKGELDYKTMFEKLNIAIHQFSKRQMTWFRKMEREGIIIHWIENSDYSKAEKILVEKYF